MILDYIKAIWLKLLLRFRKQVRNGGSIQILDGVKKDKDDERDYTYVGEGVEKPNAYSIPINPYSYVKSQGYWNSCALHSYATAIEILHDLNKTQLKGIPLSERWGYYYVRKQEGTYPNNDGVFIRDVLDLAQRNGATPEKLCPYVSSLMNEAPDNIADGFSNLWKIKYYFRIFDIEGIKEMLYTYNVPVMIGFKMNKSFTSFTEDINTSTTANLGGHEVVCYGYDEEGLLCINSWGIGYKDGGCMKVPYEYWNRNEIDTWVMTL